VSRLALAFVLALAVSSGSAAAGLPRSGVLVPGKSLGGVGLGATAGEVRARWGQPPRVCSRCAERTWYYLVEPSAGEPFGVGVAFRGGLVTAVFTLGSPRGWRTREGLRLGDGLDRAHGLYTGLSWRACIGYLALSMRQARVVTSIYANGESIYGFALTRPGEPVCR
jgi:hypothetical protein